MTRTSAALDLIGWLHQATIPGGHAVRERIHVPNLAWNTSLRSDCNTETMYAMLRAWHATGDITHLDKSRNIWTHIQAIGLQEEDGSWLFNDSGVDWGLMHWANDASEDAIYLLRAADLEPDPGRAAAYRAAALATTDWFLTIQDSSGGWRACENVPYLSPLMAAQPCAALARAYPLAPDQPAYLAAIEAGLAFVTARTGFDHRVQTSFEVHGSEERWRPPSSDQAVCVRAYAMAARFCPDSTQVDTWNAARHELLTWLTPLIHESGAIRNGYGAGVTDADVAHITDHVYTTAFAVEAYRQSFRVDNDPAQARIADGILDFAAGNLWYDPAHPDVDGCLRGAYDLTAQDFNTDEIPQNGGEEGGGNMAYTGWTAAPLAGLLLESSSSGRRGAAAGVFL